jgi:curved DNA-binding protein CbpA
VKRISDPYGALGVPRGASEAEIKAAHRALAKRYHPDSPSGNTVRFLAVQDAYKLLSDPLQRREWDARHAPGPVRASERAAARPRAANGRWTRTDATSTAGPAQTARPGQEDASRTYTWSASEVPWWEEGGRRESRRQPGQRRPRETEPEAPAQDADVYNRSSGAAWSMAARAYFRRGDTDLPRRGSFRRAGSQPLTAARARAAAEEEARRPNAASQAAPPVTPRHAEAGVAHDAESIGEVRAAARERALGAHWPTLAQRLLYASLAWLPIALVIGHGGAVATGCDRAAVSCPPELATVQTVAIALALGLLVALPRLAYALAMATAGVIAAGVALVAAIWLLGVRPPLTPAVLAVSSVLLLIVHLAVASWVLSRSSGGRRWAPARSGHRGPRAGGGR